jgi:hypothetical protein
MLKLVAKTEPYWLADEGQSEIVPGIRIQVRPATSLMKAAARNEVASLYRAEDTDSLIAWSDALIHAVARRAIVAWEGVGDLDGKPVAPSPDLIDALLNASDPVLRAFDNLYVGPALGMDAEKNASSASPNGGSVKADKTTAAPAASRAWNARSPSTPRKPSKARASGKS